MASYLEPLLIQETAPRRAQVMAGLLRNKCHDEAEILLADIRGRNPTSAVRDALVPR
jgi:hypothetical protein